MRKGENIRKRKDGRWEARYFDSNKQKYISVYARSYSAVKEKLIATIQYQNETGRKQVKKTINDICNIWLSDIKGTVKSSTYARYYDITTNHIIPSIGKIDISKVSQSMIDNFIKEKLTKGRIDKNGGLSSKTVKDICLVLNLILRANNIMLKYKVSVKKIESRVLSNDEYERFISYLFLAPDIEKISLLLSLYSGIRLGEICALKWGNIDLENGIIKVRHTIQRIKNLETDRSEKTLVIIGEPKSDNSIRDIPIQGFLIDLLTKIKQYDDYYLLTGNRKYIEPRNLQKKFKRHLKCCGLNDINFHALRHTFATKFVESNPDFKSLKEILGHSDIRFTMDCYVHSSIEKKRNQMEMIPHF